MILFYLEIISSGGVSFSICSQIQSDFFMISKLTDRHLSFLILRMSYDLVMIVAAAMIATAGTL